MGEFVINKRILLLLLLGLTIIACDKKTEKKRDVFFLVEPFSAVSDSVLKIMLINNTANNYFITLDTTRAYDYPDFNPKTNSSFILKPFVYNDDKLIYMIGEGAVQKTMDTEKGIAQSDAFYKDYITLKNAIFLKKKSSRYIEIPFLLSHKLGIFTYHYDLEKGKKYQLQLEYQMLKETTEKRITKSKLDSLQELGYTPYYEKIVSNKVPLIIE
ncbi:hypothetical protein ACM55I_14005 [Flavobacterium sp. GB2R13]|uniref:hypothetical protein n=1 Tax=Flavobacterium algoris TaxID=3398733 RepID=UPI003A850F3B